MIKQIHKEYVSIFKKEQREVQPKEETR